MVCMIWMSDTLDVRIGENQTLFAIHIHASRECVDLTEVIECTGSRDKYML